MVWEGTGDAESEVKAEEVSAPDWRGQGGAEVVEAEVVRTIFEVGDLHPPRAM